MNELFDLEEQTQCTFHDDANMEFWEIYIYIYIYIYIDNKSILSLFVRSIFVSNIKGS